MKHWPTVPFAEAVDILDSRRVPVNSAERSKRQGSIPYYGATGQTGVIDDFLFDEELVLLGEDGAPFLESGKAKAYLIRGKSWVNNHAHVLRGKPGLLNSFLLFQLNNLDYRPYVSGTTRLKLPQGPMKQIPLLVPPEDDQRRIVAEIDKQFTRLEAGVAALRRVQANLKRYRAAVLKAACEGRLVPTEAELARTEGRPFESGQQLLARILTERRQNWQGRGKYKEPANLSASGYEPDAPPQGWTWATVSEVSSVIVDCPHSTAKFVPEGHPCLDTTCMKPGRVVREKLRYVTKATFDERVERLVPEVDDIVFAREGTVGTAVAIPDDLRPCLGQRVMLMRPDSCILPAYFQHCLNSETVRHQYLPKIVGSTAPHINVAEVKMLAIPLPPLAEQTRIVAEVERRLSVVEELEAVVTTNLQRATRLRQSVLQKAFTGELSK